MDRQRTSRRDFLYIGAAAAASACAGCTLFGSRKPDVVARPQGGTIRLDPEESAALLESKGSLLVEAQAWGDKILIVHLNNGRLYAVSAICTHRGCIVDYSDVAGHLVCPCHGSEYSLEGHNLKGPAKRPLKRYDVRTEEGQVVIAPAAGGDM